MIKLNNLIKEKKLKHKIEDNTTTGKFYFKDTWKSDKSDISTLKQIVDDLEIFRKYYDNQYFTDKTLEFIHAKDFSYLESLIDNLEKTRNNITEDYEYLDDKLSFEDPFNFENSKINELKEQIQPLYSNITNLNDWRLFNENCDECSNRYTDGLIDLIREDKVDPELFEVLFDYNFAVIV